MRRIVKSPFRKSLKEYLLDTGRFQKSDKIFVSSITISGPNNVWYYISVRKAFVKGASTQRISIKKDKFENWVMLKERTEKILKLKSKIIEK